MRKEKGGDAGNDVNTHDVSIHARACGSLLCLSLCLRDVPLPHFGGHRPTVSAGSPARRRVEVGLERGRARAESISRRRSRCGGARVAREARVLGLRNVPPKHTLHLTMKKRVHFIHITKRGERELSLRNIPSKNTIITYLRVLRAPSGLRDAGCSSRFVQPKRGDIIAVLPHPRPRRPCARPVRGWRLGLVRLEEREEGSIQIKRGGGRKRLSVAWPMSSSTHETSREKKVIKYYSRVPSPKGVYNALDNFTL